MECWNQYVHMFISRYIIYIHFANKSHINLYRFPIFMCLIYSFHILYIYYPIPFYFHTQLYAIPLMPMRIYILFIVHSLLHMHFIHIPYPSIISFNATHILNMFITFTTHNLPFHILLFFYHPKYTFYIHMCIHSHKSSYFLHQHTYIITYINLPISWQSIHQQSHI